MLLLTALLLSPLVAFALPFGVGPEQSGGERDDEYEDEPVEALRCPYCRSDLPIDRAAERLRPR